MTRFTILTSRGLLRAKDRRGDLKPLLEAPLQPRQVRRGAARREIVSVDGHHDASAPVHEVARGALANLEATIQENAGVWLRPLPYKLKLSWATIPSSPGARSSAGM